MVLYRLRFDVLEKDIDDRFGISSSTVSKSWITWINFLYHTLNQLPIWPSSKVVKVVKETMPACFKDHSSILSLSFLCFSVSEALF